MITKQTIAIIGVTDTRLTTLAQCMAKGNYRLLLNDANEEGLATIVNGINKACATVDVAPANCTEEAGWEADIIMLNLCLQAEKETAAKIKEVANQKIVIHLEFALPELKEAERIQPFKTMAEEMQGLLPNSKIIEVKIHPDFIATAAAGKAATAFISGKDAEALETVSELFRAAGFQPLLTGNTINQKIESTFSI